MNQDPAHNPYAPPQAPMAALAYAQGRYAMTPSTARVEGNLLVAENGSALPPVCLKCGGAPTHWRKQRYQYTPPIAYFCLGVIGILIFTKRSTFQVPLCEPHRAEWKKWNVIAGVSCIPGVLLWIIGAAVSAVDGSVGGILLLAGTLLLLVGLITALILRTSKIVMPARIDRTHTWLRGVSPVVLQSVSSPQVAPRGYAQAAYPGAAQ